MNRTRRYAAGEGVVTVGGESASCDPYSPIISRRSGDAFDLAVQRWSQASVRLGLTEAGQAAGALLLAAELDDETRERVVGADANTVAPRRCDLLAALAEGLGEAEAVAGLMELEDRGVAAPFQSHAGPWKAAELELNRRVRAYCCGVQLQGSAPSVGRHPSVRVDLALARAAEISSREAKCLLLVLRGRSGSGRDLALIRFLALLGTPMFRRAPHELRQSTDPLEPELSGSVAVWDPRRTDPSPDDYDLARRFLSRSPSAAVTLLDRHQDAPDADGRVHLVIDVDPLDAKEREQGWVASLQRIEATSTARAAAAAELGCRSRAGVGLATRAAAMMGDSPVGGPTDLVAAVERALAALERPSTLRGIVIEHPNVALDRIIAPPDTVTALGQIVLLAQLSAAVETPGRVGVKALFCGLSGTGKTMAARAVATALRLPLYRVDLASVVSKWVGETEKNLRECLSAAEAAGAVLLFDEGDALFGKRGEVSRGADRYANMEVSYLLQAVEAYDGIAVVTTNLRGNVDSAFDRRFDVCLEFQPPAAPERAAIWRQELGQAGSELPDAVIKDIAKRADLHGGSIAAAARVARVLSLHGGRKAVAEQDLREAVRLELLKSGSSVQAARWAKEP